MVVTFKDARDEAICRALLIIASLDKQWFSETDVDVPRKLLSHMRYRGFIAGYMLQPRHRKIRHAYMLTDTGRSIAAMSQGLLKNP